MKKQLLLTLALFLFCANINAQISITDTGHCTSTTLAATLVGETSINAGIAVDDIYSAALPIGFTFNFYGTPATGLVIGDNGNLSFNLSLASSADPWQISAPLLGNTSVLNCICGPWCDVFALAGGTITYSTVGVAPNRKFVVDYCHADMYNPTDCPGQFLTSEIILYETTNIIEVHIRNHTVCTGWNSGFAIVGVQNATGTAATAAPGRDFPSTWTATNEAWRFTPTGSTSYSVSSITYSPIPYAGSTIIWVNTTTGLGIGSGASIVVTPTVTTTYEAYATGCDDTAKAFITVSPGNGPPIMGTPSVCIGDTTNLSDAMIPGTWSSSNTSVAQVTFTGRVWGIAAGTTTISYQIDSVCTSTLVVTVNATPTGGIIIGANNVCVGSTITLSDTAGTAGGTWTVTNSHATIGSTTGIVTGITSGVDTAKYTITNSCGTASVFKVFTVNPIPAVISGTPIVCIGLTTPLSDASGGGTWSSSNTGVATVTSGGLVTGVSAGTANITFTITSSGCYKTLTVTVTPTPSIILGTKTICLGGTTSLSDTVSGGTWYSNNTIIATVGSSTGIVTGLSLGTATIVYYIGTSACSQNTVVTVDPNPTAITGTMTMCIGLTTNLTDGVPGGTWSSSNTGVATVGTAGLVTGVSSGTANITYQIGASCYTVATVTVNTAPAIISGTKTICLGGTTTLTDSIGGGTWSSSNIIVATIGSGSGVVTGNASGTSTITYTIGTGCFVTTIVTVNAGTAPITPAGPVNICLFGTASLSDATTGGTWSSSNTTVAVIGTNGIVTGLAIGTANISYILSSGCYTTKTVTVNTSPTIISGPSTICSGDTAYFSDATTGGTWSSSNTSVAEVLGVYASGEGVLGISAGTATISYIIGTCYATKNITVNASPTAINPSAAVSICLGGTTTLSDGTGGGTWSSSSSIIASVGSAGLVTGLEVGTTNISYILPTGCYATKTVTVNTAPTAILPANPQVCVGSTITLTDATSGGVWSSSATGTATVSGGIVTGVATGTVTISYAIGTCYSTTTATVNPNPTAINPAGSVSICLLGTISLSDGTAGGTWSSSNTLIAGVGTSGTVTGSAIGTANISYILPTGCFVTKTVTVNNAPTPISPATATVCTGSTVTLSDTTSGGVWSSSTTGVATVSGGVVTGIATGTATITYAIGACYATATVSVGPSPAAITPVPVSICLGGNATLTDATGGGVWSSSNAGIASITSGGVVTGNGVGTATISYTAAGCSATAIVSVNTAPGSILPSNPTVCAGSTITLTDATSGGIWSSGGPAIATVVGGVVTGVVAGTANISYSIGYCSSFTTVTVNATPAAITPTPVTVCLGGTATLTDATAGGAWSSSA